ncbi:MAG: hypothetical protein OEV68_17795, partial [candidate division Zixibacteria bacterium]|nr:hypothetical protein [candidate division Zixibacteria bacterium]
MKRLATALSLTLAMVGSALAANSEESAFGPNLLQNHPDVTTYRATDEGVTRYVEGDLMRA